MMKPPSICILSRGVSLKWEQGDQFAAESPRYFETDEITQLSTDQSSLFTRFSRVYFKQSTKDSRYRELLLIP